MKSRREKLAVNIVINTKNKIKIHMTGSVENGKAKLSLKERFTILQFSEG